MLRRRCFGGGNTWRTTPPWRPAPAAASTRTPSAGPGEWPRALARPRACLPFAAALLRRSRRERSGRAPPCPEDPAAGCRWLNQHPTPAAWHGCGGVWWCGRYTWRRGSVPLWWGVHMKNNGLGEAEIKIKEQRTFKGSRRCAPRARARTARTHARTQAFLPPTAQGSVRHAACSARSAVSLGLNRAACRARTGRVVLWPCFRFVGADTCGGCRSATAPCPGSTPATRPAAAAQRPAAATPTARARPRTSTSSSSSPTPRPPPPAAAAAGHRRAARLAPPRG